MRQGHLFGLFGVTFLLTVTFAFYSLYHVDNLPYNRAEVRPRRISIAELVGQLEDDVDPSKTIQNQQKGGENKKQNAGSEGLVKPHSLPQDGIKIVSNSGYLPRKSSGTGDESVSPQDGNDNGKFQGQSDTKAENGHNLNQQMPKNLSLEKNAESPGIKNSEKAADSDANQPRIFCMLFTQVDNWATRARAVRETWAQRCDVYRFFYTPNQDKPHLPEQEAVPLHVPDGREHLTAKTMTGLKWAYENYHNKVDWFFKADDDTFVIMENLRFVAAQFRPTEPHYIGGRSVDHIRHGYNGGGAGYLLSKEAARIIIEEGPKRPTRCKTDGGVEDLDMGVCLETFKIYPIDTRDSAGRLTFHPDHPYKIFANLGDNARVYTYHLGDKNYGNPKGIRTMSPHTVSFHYVSPPFMYMYDFMLYHLVRHRDNGEPGYATPPYNYPHT